MHGKLSFSIDIHRFNDFGNKTAGKIVSTGVIFMICLALPLRFRYRLKNVFIAAILPGPREPDVNQINNPPEPLLEEPVVEWGDGFAVDLAGGTVVSGRPSLQPSPIFLQSANWPAWAPSQSDTSVISAG